MAGIAKALRDRYKAARLVLVTARIRFDSPSAIAYINYDRWLAAIPELAQKAAGNTPSLGRTISQINDEIMHIKIELGRMGVVA